MLRDQHIYKHWLVLRPLCVTERAWKDRLNLGLRNNQQEYLDHGLFISASVLTFTSNSYNWWIKHTVLLFNNSLQTLSWRKHPGPKQSRQLRPLISLSVLLLNCLFLFSLLHAGEYWQSVKDSAATVDLSYLQAQRRRPRRDSDSEAISALASLSMRAVSPDKWDGFHVDTFSVTISQQSIKCFSY